MPDLLVEIGCEELPAAACRQAQAQLPGLLEAGLARAGIQAAERRVHVAPRRLAALAFGLPGERPAERSVVRGPFLPPMTPPYFSDHRTLRRLGMALVEMESKPGAGALFSLAAAGVRG